MTELTLLILAAAPTVSSAAFAVVVVGLLRRTR